MASLTHRFSDETIESEIYSLHMTSNGDNVAVGCGDGTVKVCSTESPDRAHMTLGTARDDAMPVTTVKWVPKADGSSSQYLMCATAGGTIRMWDTPSRRLVSEFAEPENQVFCLDYRPDGSQFATVGKDTAVRIYDAGKTAPVATFRTRLGESFKAHSNRIFSCRFHRTDPSILVTGGWDNLVHVWDLRAGHSVRSVFGPHITGDAVDVCGETIVTGSYSTRDQLQLWDLGSAKLQRTVAWEPSRAGAMSATQLYVARFSDDAAGRYIVAGGTGTNEVRLFDRKRDCAHMSTVAGLAAPVFAADVRLGTGVTFGGSDGVLRHFNLVQRSGDGGGAGAQLISAAGDPISKAAAPAPAPAARPATAEPLAAGEEDPLSGDKIEGMTPSQIAAAAAGGGNGAEVARGSGLGAVRALGGRSPRRHFSRIDDAAASAAATASGEQEGKEGFD